MFWAFKMFFRLLIRLPILVFFPLYLIGCLLDSKPKRKSIKTKKQNEWIDRFEDYEALFY